MSNLVLTVSKPNKGNIVKHDQDYSTYSLHISITHLSIQYYFVKHIVTVYIDFHIFHLTNTTVC